MSYYLDFPYRFNGQGLSSTTNLNQHIRFLIHQILFTATGERINRPTFGSGVMQMVFAKNSSELGAATQMLVESALHEWLSDLIQVESVTVEVDESRLTIRVVYIVLHNQTQYDENFEYRVES